MTSCDCGASVPTVDLYGDRRHECERCGRVRELVGVSITTTVPPGALRVEELERRVDSLMRQVAGLASIVEKLLEAE